MSGVIWSTEHGNIRLVVDAEDASHVTTWRALIQDAAGPTTLSAIVGRD